MSFRREELQAIRDRSLAEAQQLGPQQLLLMRAHAELAAAADRLDAMLARDATRTTPRQFSARPIEGVTPTVTPDLLEDLEEGEEEYVPG